MDIERLSRFGSAVRDRATAAWVALQTRHWPRVKEISLDTWKRSAQAREWISKHPNLAIAPAVIVAILVLLIVGQVAVSATLIGAWFALARGISQAAADFRRRINETYSKAVSQLASDKLEERLGGIYTLENISKESRDDYWTVMETLTAFVRERSQRNERERTAISLEERISKRAYFLWEENNRPQGADFRRQAEVMEKLGEPPATDIAAVLIVLKRRSERSRERERTNGWCLDLRGAILSRADLADARLERANLMRAHLEEARLEGAHLEGADLMFARLERANLVHAHLEGATLWLAHLEGVNFGSAHLDQAKLGFTNLAGASLWDAHLKEANLEGAYLQKADLMRAHLEGANLRRAHLRETKLWRAHLEGVDLRETVGLLQEQLDDVFGDAMTRLPSGFERPAHWPPLPPDEDEDED